MSTIPDLWSYATGNPLFTAFLSVFLVVTTITIVIVVFRWYERSHEYATENALNNQMVQDMIANRNEGIAYNQAIVRQINATAAVEEQTAALMSVVTSLIAGVGGTEIAIKAKQISQSQEKQESK